MRNLVQIIKSRMQSQSLIEKIIKTGYGSFQRQICFMSEDRQIRNCKNLGSGQSGNDYVLRVIRAHINVYVENVDLIRRLNQRQESIKKYDVFNREIKKCRKELEKVAVHRERLFEDYVCRIIDAEQYETFSKQDAETEKEIQNNMEILLKHQVGYEKNFHTEEEWETLINKYRNTRTLTKEMVNAFVEKIEIHESGSITVRLVYDDMLEELRKYAKEREAELCQ